MEQLNLFATGITCTHCHQDAGRGKNPDLWNGFFDMDTQQNVCWPCRDIHYKLKQFTAFQNLFSEFPLSLFTLSFNKPKP